MPFNGPSRELSSGEYMIRKNGDSELVYCVTCGTAFIWAEGRDCPSCTLAEAMALDKAPSEVELDVSGDEYRAVRRVEDDV